MELHHTVQSLFEEEEALLNLHMNIIQENAELLTEEGRLLQQIQGDDVVDYDIDAYATRLSEILDRKASVVGVRVSFCRFVFPKGGGERVHSSVLFPCPTLLQNWHASHVVSLFGRRFVCF